jgi:uncharacterized 2Fe-2S/4Fe-4S cluster protein (DUF4445 family)
MKISEKENVVLMFKSDGAKSEFNRGTRILDAIREIGLNIRSECGGRGACGKCRVIVQESSSFSEITDVERELLSSSDLKSGYRLACQCSVFRDATVCIPDESRVITRKLLIEGDEKPVAVEPAIRKVFIRIPEPTLLDLRSDVQRLQDAVKKIYGMGVTDIDHHLLRKLPKILRDANWKATVTVWDEREIIAIQKGDTSEKAYGIAVDIGTSNVVCYLINLIDGELLAIESVGNPQAMYGEDIISRISYASKSDASLHKLQKLVINCLNSIISDVCRKNAIKPEHVYELTVVGNTAMHHIFLGLEPKYLGFSPHVPVETRPTNEKARALSLNVLPAANVHVLPVIAGFVGGDAVGDIISTRIYESDEPSMVLDVGTNAEVIIGDDHGLMACSCASGPAFEGARIRCGMKATIGAIEKLQIEPTRCEVSYETIGNAKPMGLCGSAIIDVVANLLKNRIIDRNGKFMDSPLTPRLKTVGGEKRFHLVSKKKGATHDIFITQKDIREVQLAKAAIYTGCHTLVKKKNLERKDIKKLFVAGAFGNYLNLENSKIIGLLPDVPTELITLVGNAAGAGARMTLLSKRQRQIAASINRKVDYVELALEPDFQMEFASAMFFPHRELGRFPSVQNIF